MDRQIITQHSHSHSPGADNFTCNIVWFCA